MIAGTVDAQWVPRRVLSVAVRIVQYALPLVLATFAAGLVARLIEDRTSTRVGIALGLGVAVAVSLIVSRLTMRLAPLAVLLQMTMIFPDHAPSRLKVARRSTSSGEIRRRLLSDRSDEQEAAVTMLALVTALGRHDKRTRGHSERVRLFCDLLSRELGLSAADAGRLRWAALIHDIGKLEVSAAVLNKPGRLNRDEWASVRLHPEAGARLAKPLEDWLGPWFSGIIEHHERYDGGGYPRGLAGDRISLAGRAVAVVDAFETMTAARSYRAAVTAVAARAELTRCAGSHFDPAMVRAFLAIALPRLLWSVGPLAFVVNVPFLRWIGDGGVRFAQAASTTALGAANAAGVTAVAVAAGAMPGTTVSTIPTYPDLVHVSQPVPAAGRSWTADPRVGAGRLTIPAPYDVASPAVVSKAAAVNAASSAKPAHGNSGGGADPSTTRGRGDPPGNAYGHEKQGKSVHSGDGGSGKSVSGRSQPGSPHSSGPASRGSTSGHSNGSGHSGK